MSYSAGWKEHLLTRSDVKKFFRILSSVFYRLHRLTQQYGAAHKLHKPYRLNYTPVQGLPKIIHVNGNFVIGGTSQLIVDLVERSSDKYLHKIIVPKIPKPIPYQPVNIKEFSLENMSAAYRYLRDEKPDLITLHYWVRPMHRHRDFSIWYNNIFSICEELDIPVIQNVVVPAPPHTSKAVRHNVFVSNYVRDHFDNGDLPSSVIYPGSDLDHFRSANKGDKPFAFGMVYRLDQDKLNAEAIDVFIEVVKQLPEARCYIIGAGYYLDAYREKVKNAGLTDNFIFTGYVSYHDLPGYYEKLGLIVAPVHDESFGQVSVFAMGMGIPVAGYNTGALSEILGSDETLVEYGNVKALSELIVELAKDPVRRKQLAEFNLHRANKLFRVDQMVDAWCKLYNLTLQDKTVLQNG